MEFNTEIRKKQLDNLDQLIASSRKRIQSVLNYLGWSEENVKKEDHLVQCPVNGHHRINPRLWTEHIEKCIVQFEGYDQKSQFLSESLDNPSQSIYLDHNKKVELITKELSKRGPLRLAWNGLDPDPRTADRWITTYSSDERLLFYNYCIENTTGPPAPPEFTTIHDKNTDEEKPPTYEEILAQERDAKRRRVKYKSVHISRKNHTEVIREVIDGQMEEYKEWLSAKEQPNKPEREQCNNGNGVNEDKKDDHERPHSSISRTSNHSSSSRSTNKRCDRSSRNGRERSRERHNSRNEKTYKIDDRYRRKSPYRRPHEERRHRSRDSRERRRSRDKDRQYSSRERSYKHNHDSRRH